MDGVCCDKACESSCEACDGVTPGVCEFVVGVPRGEREACPEGTVCNGTEAECVGLGLCREPEERGNAVATSAAIGWLGGSQGRPLLAAGQAVAIGPGAGRGRRGR